MAEDKYTTQVIHEIDPLMRAQGLFEAFWQQKYASEGKKFGKPNSKGYVHCSAIDRIDKNASATVNVFTGQYRDRIPCGRCQSFWKFNATEDGCEVIDVVKRYCEILGHELPEFNGPKRRRKKSKRKASKPKTQQSGGENNMEDVKLSGTSEASEASETSENPKTASPFNPRNHFEEIGDDDYGQICRIRPGITEGAIKLAGGVTGFYPASTPLNKAVAFTAYNRQLEPVAIHVMSLTSKSLAHRKVGDDGNWETVQAEDSSRKVIVHGTPAFGIVNKHAVDHLHEADHVWIVEGISDMLTMQTVLRDRTDHVVFTSGGASTPLPDEWLSELAGKNVYVTYDVDTGGEKCPAQKSARELCRRIAKFYPESLINVLLPAPSSKVGTDLRDYLNAGYGLEDLLALAARCQPFARRHLSCNSGIYEISPCEIQPGKYQIPIDGYKILNKQIAAIAGYLTREVLTDVYSWLGAELCRIGTDSEGMLFRKPISASTYRTLIEDVGTTVEIPKGGDDDDDDNGHKDDGKEKVRREPEQTRMCESTSKMILTSQHFHDEMRQVSRISPSPILVPDGGKLEVVTGYHEPSQTVARGTVVVPESYQHAVERLLELFVDFRFASPSNRSRAIASMLSPALLHARLIDRAPIDVAMADMTGAGKGYRLKMVCSLYNAKATAVSEPKKGVGSLEESFQKCLIDGDPFIQFDNLKGELDSSLLESFMTEAYSNARVAYSKNVRINNRNYYILLSTNSMKMTTDLARRCSIVKIDRQPGDYDWRFVRRHGLSPVEHIERNQPEYLGFVFSILQEWYRRGQPKSEGIGVPSFESWWQICDWIVREIFGQAPLMDGHDQIAEEMTNPMKKEFRDLLLAMDKRGLITGEPMQASSFINLMNRNGWTFLGHDPSEHDDSERFRKQCQSFGIKVSNIFSSDKKDWKEEEGHQDEIQIDRWTIIRRAYLSDSRRKKFSKEYIILAPDKQQQHDFFEEEF